APTADSPAPAAPTADSPAPAPAAPASPAPAAPVEPSAPEPAPELGVGVGGGAAVGLGAPLLDDDLGGGDASDHEMMEEASRHLEAPGADADDYPDDFEDTVQGPLDVSASAAPAAPSAPLPAPEAPSPPARPSPASPADDYEDDFEQTLQGEPEVEVTESPALLKEVEQLKSKQERAPSEARKSLADEWGVEWRKLGPYPEASAAGRGRSAAAAGRGEPLGPLRRDRGLRAGVRRGGRRVRRRRRRAARRVGRQAGSSAGIQVQRQHRPRARRGRRRCPGGRADPARRGRVRGGLRGVPLVTSARGTRLLLPRSPWFSNTSGSASLFHAPAVVGYVLPCPPVSLASPAAPRMSVRGCSSSRHRYSSPSPCCWLNYQPCARLFHCATTRSRVYLRR
ncbi:unnamed protein product, partial [Prorocentrum cordatum]